MEVFFLGCSVLCILGAMGVNAISSMQNKSSFAGLQTKLDKRDNRDAFWPRPRCDDDDGIAFDAYTISTDVLRKDETIVMNATYFNGGGYDSSTGQFTAKTYGTYVFGGSLCTQTNRFLNFRIKRRSGNIVAEGMKNTNTDGESCYAHFSFAAMDKGDFVWMETFNDGSDDVVMDELWWATFFGAFIIN